MSKRYRCTHCQTVFTAGDVRDCCLPAAVAEQRRLRRKLSEAELMGKLKSFARHTHQAVSK